jgi:hypothetical protein
VNTAAQRRLEVNCEAMSSSRKPADSPNDRGSA